MSETTMPGGEDLDAALLAGIRTDGGQPAIDVYEASKLVQELATCDVDDVVPDGDGFRVSLRVLGTTTALRLSDLARILRIPGTLNHKDPASPQEVTVLSVSGRRYNLSDFEEFLDREGIPDVEAQEKAARDWAEHFSNKPLVIDLTRRIPQDGSTAGCARTCGFGIPGSGSATI